MYTTVASSNKQQYEESSHRGLRFQVLAEVACTGSFEVEVAVSRSELRALSGKQKKERELLIKSTS
jgi:hypothetical protein